MEVQQQAEHQMCSCHNGMQRCCRMARPAQAARDHLVCCHANKPEDKLSALQVGGLMHDKPWHALNRGDMGCNAW